MDHINAKINAMRGKPSGQSLEEEIKRLSLFICDAKTRRLLYLESKDIFEAWSFIKSMPFSSNCPNRQALRYIKGTEIDLQNILRIYRLKRYYPEEEVFAHLIPVCYKLSKAMIKQMAESPGAAEFIVAVKHSPYAHISFENIELSIAQEMRRVNSRATKRYPRSVAGLMAYLFTKKLEMRNLTAKEEATKHERGDLLCLH